MLYPMSLLRWLLGMSVLLFLILLFFLLNLFVSHRRLNGFLRFLSRSILAIGGCKLEVRGLEHLDPKKTYVFIFNHSNIFDHFAISAGLPMLVRGIEKASHFSWPIYGWLLKRAEVVPIIPRGNTESAMGSIERAKTLFRSGISMAIAPEGTRSPDGHLLPFKKGGFHMAIDLQADIVPLVFRGMHRFNQKNGFLLRPGKVVMEILPPVLTENCTRKDSTLLRDRMYMKYLEKLSAD